MTIFIVDGIDRCGKSTLARALSNEFKIPLFKDIGTTETLEKELAPREIIGGKNATTLGMLESLSPEVGIIFDRLLYSEFVYGLLHRGYVAFDFLEFDARLAALNTALILVETTDIERSNRQHGSDLSQHQELFRVAYRASKIKDKMIVKYDDFEDAIHWADEVLYKHETRQYAQVVVQEMGIRTRVMFDDYVKALWGLGD